MGRNPPNAELIRSILSGRSKNPRRDTLEALAAELDVSVAWLTGETDDTGAEGEDEAVSWDGDNNALRALLLSALPDSCVIMMATATRSMTMAGIMPQDLLVLDTARTPADGDTVICTVRQPDGETRTVLRRWREDDNHPDHAMLVSRSHRGEIRPLYVDHNRVTVRGVVLRAYRDQVGPKTGTRI